MSFLEEIYEASKKELKGANIVIERAGIELGLNIEIGSNRNWCLSEDDIEEQAVHANEELIKLLDEKSVSYSDCLKEDFLNIGPDDEVNIYLTDESGTYIVVLYVGHLDVGNTSCLNYWIDFNGIAKQ